MLITRLHLRLMHYPAPQISMLERNNYLPLMMPSAKSIVLDSLPALLETLERAEWDDQGRLLSYTIGAGARQQTTSFTYEPEAIIGTLVLPYGVTIKTVFDTEGHLLKEMIIGNSPNHPVVTRAEQIYITGQTGKKLLQYTIEYTLDESHTSIPVADSDEVSVEMTFGQRPNATPLTTKHEYDEFDRPVRIHTIDGIHEYQYADAESFFPVRIIEHMSQNLKRYSDFTFDDRGNTTGIRRYIDANTVLDSIDFFYEYDADNNIVSQTRIIEPANDIIIDFSAYRSAIFKTEDTVLNPT